MKVYLLEATWGDYADASSAVLGTFSSRELAEQAKDNIIDNADRDIWPWNKIDNNEWLFHITEVELNKLLFILNIDLTPAQSQAKLK